MKIQWGQGAAGFFIGAAAFYAFVLALIPHIPVEATKDPSGDVMGWFVALVFSPLLLVPLLGLFLIFMAYQHRKDKNKMLTLLLPGILIILLSIFMLFGGVGL